MDNDEIKAERVETVRPLTYNPDGEIMEDPRNLKKRKAAVVLSKMMQEYFAELQGRIVANVAEVSGGKNV